MKNVPSISESEWLVMKCVWEMDRPTFPKIKKALQYKNWSDNTISTFLARLVKKGAAKTEGAPKEYVYIPLVTEEECLRQENKTFLNRLYEGSAAALIRNFIYQEALSNEEVEDLILMLKKRNK